jgi:endonuclease/exonuclease/phosphatase family metal-dependent hydrolase
MKKPSLLSLFLFFVLCLQIKAQTTTSTIAEARKVKAGIPVTVAGRVIATTQLGSTAYIQDGTAGIAVFNSTFASSVAIGDSVKVSGLMSAFNAQLQIGTGASTVDFTKINVPNKPVTPKVITIAQAKDFESQLVTIKDVEFVDNKFVFVPNSNYSIFSGTQTPLLDLRIVNTTNLVGRTKPQSKVSATGIMGLFNTTYQLQPRFIEDLPSTEAYKKPQTGLAADKTFKLVTWNTNWLGNTANGPTNELLQQKNFQQVLDSLKADVYVLEEVSNLPVFNLIVSKNTNYKGFCTTAISAGGVAADAQRVCFMYKKGVIDSVSARPLLTKATTLPNYPENNPARFWASGRLPFLFIADANIDGVKKRLHIIGIHARANTGGTTATLDAKELQYAQRKYDVNVLKDTLDAQFPNANIILAGDYNDDVDETVSEIISTKESSYKKFVDDTKNYQVVTKTLSDNGFRSYISQNNVIDHVMVSNELVDNYVVNSASPELGFLYINSYSSTTSDHLPIYATFNFEIKSPTELTAKTDTYDKATLTWKDNTNNETGFEIERSTDGITFAKVGDAAVNITTFTNENLKDGVKYSYRLRTVTAEGKSKYSNVAEVTTVKILASEPSEGDLTIKISPNPTSGNIRIQAEGKSFDFSLMNISGKSIVENTGNLEVVNQSVNGKLSTILSGVYILRMQSGDRRGVLKIVKE